MLKDKRFLADFNLVEELDTNEAEAISGGARVGKLKVFANNEGGIFFQNPFGQSSEFIIEGLGSWAYGPESGQVVGANGRGGCSGCTLSNPFGGGAALIMQRSNGDYEFVGERKEVTLGGGEFVRFLMNDTPGTYGNNEGWLGVIISTKT